jgi:membrane fusion protein
MPQFTSSIEAFVDKPLFRIEAIQHRQSHWLGSVLLLRPISFSLWTAFAAAVAIAVLAFLFWGTYAKKSRLTGFLQPERGIVKVQPRETGTVLERHVQEGQQISRGDVLFVLSGERASSQQPEVHASIGRQLESRKLSLQNDLAQQQLLLDQQAVAVRARVAGMQNEAVQLEREAALQARRVKSFEGQLENYKRLHEQNFFSSFALQQKQDELLEQQSRLHALARTRMVLARDLASLQSELRELPIRAGTQSANIARTITATEQEITENEARRQTIVRAPQSGIATAVLAEVGQLANGQAPLLSIVPANSKLIAHLFAPSSAIGFIAPGHQVLLRYQAFPYQKFGQQGGKVVSISRTALQQTELPFSMPAGAEPLYRIEVVLDAQNVKAYGQLQALQAGMQLEADVVLDTRRLIEWVFEPLYSLTGRA